MRDHSLSSTMVGSAMESLRNARMSVLRLSASTSASRLSSLAPETVKRSRKAVELLGVDGIDIETALEQGLDDRPVRRLDGDMDLASCPSACFQQPGDHVTEARPPVGELPLSDLRTCIIVQ